MSKLVLLAIIILAIAGIVTGVFEVKVHPEKLVGVPALTQQWIGEGNILSQSEYYLTTWKRKAEIGITGSDEKKFELYVRYVGQDTNKLKDALDQKKSPDSIILRTRLLNESLEQAKEAVEKLSNETIATVRDAWLKALASANSELGRLSGLADEYKKYQQELEKAVPEASPSPKASTIELKF